MSERKVSKARVVAEYFAANLIADGFVRRGTKQQKKGWLKEIANRFQSHAEIVHRSRVEAARATK